MKIEFDSTYEIMEAVHAMVNCKVEINGEMFHVDDYSWPPQIKETMDITSCDLGDVYNEFQHAILKERCDLKGIVMTLSWMGNLEEHQIAVQKAKDEADEAGVNMVIWDMYPSIFFSDITKLIKG